MQAPVAICPEEEIAIEAQAQEHATRKHQNIAKLSSMI